MELDKQFFLPGDVVTIRQDIPNKPTMLVVKKVTRSIKIDNVKNDYFQGILCRWFTTEGTLQESIFNTKDLLKLT
jgi:uncharacterized protein YodC (DUF2158 family)